VSRAKPKQYVFPDRTRECSDCKRTKPWKEFWPRTYWDDGSVRNITSVCRDCNRERAKIRAKDRWKNLKADPQALAVHHIRRAEWNAGYRRERGAQPVNTVEPLAVSEPEFDRVPVGPFRSWLQERLEGEHDGSVNSFAQILGVDEARVRVWLGDKAQSRSDFMTHIAVGTVDRALCSAHEPEMLRVLYPEWYEQPFRREADDHWRRALGLPVMPRPAKTHCQRGHEFTEENTRFRNDGTRVCRACDRLRQSQRAA
jgi:hypothetical protein